ncbi:MAG: carboxylating nicotinate-nucleotide diphosphorylase, partial [Paraclostridium sp.]
MNYLIIDKIIKDALIEDIPNDDISTNCVIDEISNCSVELLCKESGIIAGLDVFKRVFEIIGDVDIKLLKKDGDIIKNKERIAYIEGNTRNILLGERVALNLLQRMSGIATLTSLFVKELDGSKAKVLDTRKTTPNLRVLEKYAVKIGGGCNHRFNLSDGIMLKDNHISACGGVKNAVKLARESNSFVRKIEVETESLDMVKEAIDAGADIIMLDNMDLEMATEAVKLINKRAIIEFSGNVSMNN